MTSSSAPQVIISARNRSRLLMGGIALTALAASLGMAQPAMADVQVGDSIINPVTGKSEKVTYLLVDNITGAQSGVVITNLNNIIKLTAPTLNSATPSGFTVSSYIYSVPIDGSSSVIDGYKLSDGSSVLLANPNVAVGDLVINPTTGASETITTIVLDQSTGFPNGKVVTDKNNIIDLLIPALNSKNTTGASGATVTSYTYAAAVNGAPSVIDGYNLSDGSTVSLAAPVPAHSTQDNVGKIDPAPATGSVGTISGSATSGYRNIQIAAGGSNGTNGYGVGFCIPFIGCAVIGYSGSSGGSGDNGPNITVTDADITDANHKTLSPITTIADSTPGIVVRSVGGSGGSGGNPYGYLPPLNGGAAGAGGNVNVTTSTDVTTSGESSYGIFVQSEAGNGGNGGTGYIFSGGGSGGPVAKAGTATATNSGNITTFGNNAVGFYVQSLGGNGGSGGGSEGVVGDANSGSTGGQGSDAMGTNSGIITTSGIGAYGFEVQSVGGSGGNGGTGKGIFAAGGDGGGGGDAGNVTASNVAGGSITTTGIKSTGILAQSIGGSGGAGGNASGPISIGGSGGDGGNGGQVTVNDSGNVTTTAADSRGIMAESVGGGGGDGGGANSASAFAGLAIGGQGGKGGTSAGATVSFSSELNGGIAINPTIKTSGDRSTGVFVQSVGGGGGNGGVANTATGGAFGAVSIAIGGAGGDGGAGGKAAINGSATVITTGQNAVGMFVQSVGGGGGNGGAAISIAAARGPASGALAIGVGGSGGKGGDGGAVTVNSGGFISTTGDMSEGLLAQSVGGGGGNGGFAITASAAGGAVASFAGTVGVGGTGGSGGAAGTVDATFVGGVKTAGDYSDAILLQAVGGGGGNGGFNIAGSFAGAGVADAAIAVGVGGSGGDGGDGGAVTGTITGNIATGGNGSSGLVAQSIGGSGGNGGFNISGSLAAAGAGSGAVAVGVGGSGGGAGDGKAVSATLNGNTTTSGADADGFLAQSVGGGGGNGAFNISGALSGAGVGSGAVSVGIGGSGGGGGGGDTVTAAVNGNATTTGDRSAAFVAQSLGGGGGNGGFNVSGALSAAGSAAGAVSVGIGGAGGSGGSGSSVFATFTGNISTKGTSAGGYLAQSVGGGGGNGAFNVSGAIAASGAGAGTVSVGIGGSGGSGGSGGAVTAYQAGNITTAGALADGFVAQSLGGGGGNGGFNVSGALSAAGTGAGSVSVGIGGSGGSGGRASSAMATILGDVATGGEDATAILVQSAGGGGGNGGFDITGGISAAGTGAGAVSVGIGGSGGGGGNGAATTLSLTGNVSTQGAGADGVVVQSLGGGGGNGGFNVTGTLSAAGDGAGSVGVGVGGAGGDGGIGGTVNASIIGDITTAMQDAHAVTIQSLGGGGGNGGFNVTGTLSAAGDGAGSVGIGVGGFGGGGKAGGDVTGNLTGNIQTSGAGANGLLVQSVGGGGGSGGFNVTEGLTGSSKSGSLGVGIGGFGGSGGDGGVVSSTVIGDILTAGDTAYGALIQSVGGGGGQGGMNVTGQVALSSGSGGAISVGVGGFGGGGGNSSSVTGSLDGNVQTSGDGAFAVMAQSVGGGGGSGGMDIAGAVSVSTGTSGAVSIGVGGFGGSGGSSGDVTYTRTGDTTTLGAGSNGVTVQSLGGGGGSGGLNISGGISGSTSGSAAEATIGIGGFGGDGGSSGDVSATVAGNVNVTGSGVRQFETIDGVGREVRSGGSSGIIAQSVGGSGGSGGINISGGIALTSSSGSGYGLTLGLGGFGGSGGNAGTVNLVVTGDPATVTSAAGASPAVVVSVINAFGDDQTAVLAQSVGGGGGAGALNISGGITTDGAVTAGVGGFGGAGGSGADVNASVTANITMTGANSRGFAAQSIGGGGGIGAINISGGISTSKASTNSSLVFGLGGSGGAANVSGNVVATQSGSVTVVGTDSIGVLVQSVAGGGGSGGLNVSADITAGKGYNAAIGIGGNGGAGANAGNVTLTSDGSISVDGRQSVDTATTADTGATTTNFSERANGILAQSIGGGGGVGGINVAAAITPYGSPLVAGVGGSGGAGGNAGTVEVNRGLTNASLLQTFGNQANGLTAQSVGGGGGLAGMDFIFSLTVKADSPNEVQLAVGGSGGAAGNGAAVLVNEIGTITTAGDQSDGILAQSVGGGGGSANFNIGGGVDRNATGVNLAIGGGTGDGGTGGAVTVSNQGNITTLGVDSSAIFAQSVGGGGGNASINMSTALMASSTLNIALGRSGGTGGAAGDVTVTSAGTLQTSGASATAVFAQSVGNGGGKSGTSSISASSSSGEGDSKSSSRAGLSIGLDGGAGGTSGNVAVTTSGLIETVGDDAYGIQAQSVGGGGGQGGGALNLVIRQSAGASVSVGGNGGTGAVSGTVNVANSAEILTKGSNASGIYAQSIGGGGGDGNYAAVLSLLATGASDNGSVTGSLSIGGTGGVGGQSSTVSVLNSGIIYTQGTKAFGIDAQSIGGGGGAGGMVLDGTIAGTGGNSSTSIGIGGTGGQGGTGGDVDVTNTGTILTDGDSATGMRAQSIGGGGGDAGLVMNLSIAATSDNSSQQLAVNIGGTGGQGGTSGNVTASNNLDATGAGGVIATTGKDAYGIFAQSIGGGGGNGSAVISAVIAGGKNSTLAGLNIGGSGGEGNDAGSVIVNNQGLIETSGEGAHGIYAQSIGGGGGNGGVSLAVDAVLSKGGSSPMLTIGGSGGKGGDGGSVTVNNSGTIYTSGANSYGIYAQSIGGGGGNGNLGIGLGSATSTLIGNTISAAIGGYNGGEGGLGGNVVVNQSGSITVLGDGSQAIRAESVNGGGGDVVLDLNGITSLPGGSPLSGGTTTSPVLKVMAGGQQQVNTGGGNVTLNLTGSFGVAGDNGAAIGARSIGGGGGSYQTKVTITDSGAMDSLAFQSQLGGTGGSNNQGGDLLGSQHNGSLLTEGRNTSGVVLQSVGGGGGQSTTTILTGYGQIGGGVDLSLGGSSGLNGSGGAISHTETGAILTKGDQSFGLLLQSVGGGGGITDFWIGQAASTEPVVTAVRALSVTASTATASTVTLGGNGGSGNDGQDVTLIRSGDTQTLGSSAIGIFEQSIGGGGGIAQVAGLNDIALGIGGTNGASGSGGDITLTNSGSVTTSGDRSHAIFVQSIGGGGGALFTDANAITVTTNSDNVGNGGAIVLSQSGNVSATGDQAFGIFAQSIGGGGGFADGAFAGSAGGVGTGGAVTVNVDGSVFAPGLNSSAVVLQSLGASGAGDISLTSNGALRGGSGSGAGVEIDGGANNLVQSSGSLSAVSGLAVLAGAGNDTVINAGLAVGNFDLGGGNNQLINQHGATLITFDTLNLQHGTGSTGTFTNNGELAFGLSASRTPIDLAAGETFAAYVSADPTTDLLYGVKTIDQVALNGNFVQGKLGHSSFDVAFGPYASDRLNATGTALVAGTADITLTWLENSKPVLLIAAAGGGVDQGLKVGDTLAIDYYVIAGADGIELGFKSNFGLPFLNANEQSLGGSLDSAVQVGNAGGIGRLMALLGNMTAGQEKAYASVMDQLNPELFLAPSLVQFQAAQDFGTGLFGCRQVNDQSQHKCTWARADSSNIKRNTSHGELPFQDLNGARMRMGIELPYGHGWALAGAAGYDSESEIHFNGARAVGSISGFHAGIGMRKAFGKGDQGTVSLGITGGQQWVNMSRTQNIFVNGLGLSKYTTNYFGANGNIGWTSDTGPIFARPEIDFSVIGLGVNGFKEQGLLGLGIQGFQHRQWIATAAPKMTLGAKFGRVAKLTASSGVVLHNTSSFAAPYRLLGADNAANAATIRSDFDAISMFGGADMLIAKNWLSLEFGYRNEFGRTTNSQNFHATLKFAF